MYDCIRTLGSMLVLFETSKTTSFLTPHRVYQNLHKRPVRHRLRREDL